MSLADRWPRTAVGRAAARWHAEHGGASRTMDGGVEAFWFRVRPHRESGCWLWAGAGETQGYGSFAIGRAQVPAHRAAWEILVGEIPAGMVVDHACEVPCCVNPQHLQVISSRRNLSLGRIRRRAFDGNREREARQRAALLAHAILKRACPILSMVDFRKEAA